VPDWNAIVRERLQGLAVSPAQRDEIIAELAGHLEDLCQQQQAEGENESAVVRRTLEQVTDWHRLARQIQCAKRKEETMNYRTKTLWLPGLISLTAAMVWLMIVEFINSEPHVLGMRQIAFDFAPWPHLLPGAYDAFLLICVPWLLFLPLCGGVGAYLSRRAGGERRTSIAAGLFPSIVLLGIFLCLILPLAVFWERNAFVIHHPLYFAGGALLSTAVPGVALFLGVVPFLKTTKLRQS
jgi:hypothetical protein